MKPSPLELLNYLAYETSCSANASFDPDKPVTPGKGQPEIGVSAARQKKPEGFEGNLWAIEMRISQKLEGQNFPYAVKVALVGMFAYRDGTATPEAEEKFVRVNGSSMLYGAAREIVRSMTSRGPWEQLFLPSLSFYEPKPETKQE